MISGDLDLGHSRTLRENASIWDLLSWRARTGGDAVQVSDGNASLSASALATMAEAIACVLADDGVRRGDRVAVMADERLASVAIWLAVVRLGAVEVPVNTTARGPLLDRVLGHSGAVAAVVGDKYATAVEAVSERHSDLRTVYRLDALLDAASGQHGSTPAETGSPAVDDWASILFTSGTTGPAKGVVLTHGYFVQHGQLKIGDLGLAEDSVLYSCLPLFHINAKVVTIMAALACGGRAELRPAFHASTFWRDASAAGATHITFVGNMAAALLAQPPSEADTAHSVRVAYGSPVPDGRHAEFEERFGVALATGFGMTEAARVMVNPPGSGRYGSLGSPSSSFDVMIERSDGTWSTGTEEGAGELCVRPRGRNLMSIGYLNDPAGSMASRRDLWFHTGDVVRRDANGYYWLVGRVDDVIRRKGENISLADVDRVLAGLDGVQEGVAVGVPAVTGEHDIKLVVVVAPRARIRHADLLEVVAVELPKFSEPRYIEMVDALPRTATGRVERYKLRDGWRTASTWDRHRGTWVDLPDQQDTVPEVLS